MQQSQNSTYQKLYRKNRRLQELKNADIVKQDVAQYNLKRKLAEENAYDEGLDDEEVGSTTSIPKPMSLVLSELKCTGDERLVYSDLVSHARHELITKKQKRFCNATRDTDSYLRKVALFQLLDWQEDVQLFLENRESDRERIGSRGGMLCSDMGLGKTLNCLSYMLFDNQRCYRQTGNRYNGCTLIAVPNKLVIEGWISEIKSKWPPGTFQYHILHSSKNRLIDRAYIENGCDFLIVTYATIKAAYRHRLNQEAQRREMDVIQEEEDDEVEDEDEVLDEEVEEIEEEKKEEEAAASSPEARLKRQREQDYRSDILFNIRWKRVMADESHNFVNKRTFLFKAMMMLWALIKWVVTGTPIQNRLIDICSNFDFIGVPEVVPGVAHHSSIKDIDVSEEDRVKIREMLKIVMTRKLKSEINTMDSKMAMMPIIKTIRLIEFESLAEKVIYSMYATYGSRTWRSNLSNDDDMEDDDGVARRPVYKNTNIASILQLMMQLCMGVRIVDGLVLPHGMLTMGDEGELRLKETQHKEAILEMGRDTLTYTKDDNTLEYYASRLAKKTTFHYKSKSDTLLNVPDGYSLEYHRNLESGAASTTTVKDTDFVWDPFKKDKHFDLEHCEEDRETYTALYHTIYKDGAKKVMREAKKEKNRVKQAMIKHLVARTLRPPHYSTKNRHIIKYVLEEVPKDDKVIVFSNSNTALDCLERDLRAHGISSIVVNGKTPDNIERIATFKQGCPVNGPKVLLLSLKLGNVGLNICCANHIILLHPHWNPCTIQQAIDRAHRLGQLKNVYIVCFIMNDTIDLYVLNRAHDKKFMATSMIGDDVKEPDMATTKRIEQYAYSLYEYSITQ